LHVRDAFAKPWGDVDHVLTDPPYDAAVFDKARTCGSLSTDPKYQGQSQAAPRLVFEYDPADPDMSRRFAAFVGEHCRRWCVFTLDAESIHEWRQRLTEAGVVHVRQGFFHRPNATPQFSGDRPAQPGDFVEIAHAAGKLRWNGGGKSAYWVGFRERGAIRKGQKPLTLLRAWVEQFTDPGELICDPFTGSGTTGVAAVSMGRKFVGYEIDPAMAKKAAARIREASKQQRLYLNREPRPKPQQVTLLA